MIWIAKPAYVSSYRALTLQDEKPNGFIDFYESDRMTVELYIVLLTQKRFIIQIRDAMIVTL